MLFKNCRFPWISHVNISTLISISMFVRHIPDSWLVILAWCTSSLYQININQPNFCWSKYVQLFIIFFLCCSKPFFSSGKMRETSAAEPAVCVRSLVMRPLTKKRERSRDPAETLRRTLLFCFVVDESK